MCVGMSNKNKSLKRARGLENEVSNTNKSLKRNQGFENEPFSQMISEATHNLRTTAIYYSVFNIESAEEMRCVNKLGKSKWFTNSRKNLLIFFNILRWLLQGKGQHLREYTLESNPGFDIDRCGGKA